MTFFTFVYTYGRPFLLWEAYCYMKGSFFLLFLRKRVIRISFPYIYIYINIHTRRNVFCINSKPPLRFSCTF